MASLGLNQLRANNRGDRIDGPWILVKKENAVKPFDGAIVMTDRWWIVTSEGEIMFYRGYGAPQCNSNKEISLMIAKRAMHAAFNPVVECLAVVFVPNY